TGDLSELAVQAGARVVGADFAANMLAGARRRRIGAAVVQAGGGPLAPPASGGSRGVSRFGLPEFLFVSTRACRGSSGAEAWRAAGFAGSGHSQQPATALGTQPLFQSCRSPARRAAFGCMGVYLLAALGVVPPWE